MTRKLSQKSRFAYKALPILVLGLGLAACTSNLSPEDRAMIEQAKADAAAAKSDTMRANDALEEAKLSNERARMASEEAAAAAAAAELSAEKAARIAAELEALYNKQLRK